LTSISASYAKAEAHRGDPEEADILRATSVIELIADEKIPKQARLLQIKVKEVHGRIRQGDSEAEKEVPHVDHTRRELIELFKADLDIPLRSYSGKAASRAEASDHADTDQSK
jgi:hypothetical protein